MIYYNNKLYWDYIDKLHYYQTFLHSLYLLAAPQSNNILGKAVCNLIIHDVINVKPI